jgi:hypothetical protein
VASGEIAASPDSAGGEAGAWGLIGRYGGKHGRRLAMAWGIYTSVKPVYRKVKERLDSRNHFTVKIEGTDNLFGDVHEWMLSQLDDSNRRALIATTGGRGMFASAMSIGMPDSDGGIREYGSTAVAAPRKMIRLRYDGGRTHQVVLGGHKVTVSIERDEMRNWDKIPDDWQAMSQRIIFAADGAAGRDAVIEHLQAMLDAKAEKPGPPPLMMPPKWGGHWNRRNDLPPRTLDSIVLKTGQLEHLIGDLAEFLESEEDYVRTSQPWHRGYLLSGPPGTGKTSVVKAIAHHFGMPIYYLPLGDLEKDADLTNLVAQVEPRSLLLLEDVDVYHAATQRDEDGRVTLSALLNGLDGVWTPHGLVSVLTTNDRDALDPALIRAGRIDVDERFTNLDLDQGVRLVNWFYRLPPGGTLGVPEGMKFDGRSPAELIGAMSRAKTDPTEALRIFLADG